MNMEFIQVKYIYFKFDKIIGKVSFIFLTIDFEIKMDKNGKILNNSKKSEVFYRYLFLKF